MNRELSDFAARWCEVVSFGGHCFVNAPISQGSGQALHSISNDSSFNRVALELFALQFHHNDAYRKICQSRGLTPDRVARWTQIPAVPTSAFKELDLSCIPPGERTVVFHSSGTTEQIRSRHYHNAESLAVYEASLWPWFRQHVLPESGAGNPECGVLILSPPPKQAPNSSLVHMFETIRRNLGGASVPASRVFPGRLTMDGSWTLDFDATLAVLNSSVVTRHPTLVLGTAFSFVHLLDFLSEHGLRFQLPAGSRVMETGGYKNRSRSMPKEGLHSLIAERLGVPCEDIICEYGMSELSSQAYDSVASHERRAARNSHSRHPSPVARHFSFPPWAQVQIISPETGREVAEGEPGLIRIFDLANIFSVMAIQTEDMGIRHQDGFELIGRAQHAEPRGCSLMMQGSASSLP